MTTYEVWAEKWAQRADIYNRIAKDMEKAGLHPSVLRRLVVATEIEVEARRRVERAKVVT